MTEQQREYLFISYANEDATLAEWLTLKLTAEGYKVWCYSVQLLGGESYPRDIDKAIKEKTYRMIALLSKHSLSKPNPVKERTLALNLGRERGVDFLIPLNVDGLSPIELDWMTSDLVFIPFYENWAKGLNQLLKKLQSIGTPCNLKNGKETAAAWLDSRSTVAQRSETLWTNLLEIKEIPRAMLKIGLQQPDQFVWPPNWVYHSQSKDILWSFEKPEHIGEANILESTEWNNEIGQAGFRPSNAVTTILKDYLRLMCLKKGLRETLDRRLYFPPEMLPGNQLTYRRYDGKMSHVLACGERTFRTARGVRQKSRYHLSPVFRPLLRDFANPVLQVNLRLHLTDVDGRPLDEHTSLRRRKRICKDWWNHEWLSRLLAVIYWMADGQETFDITMNPSCKIVLSGIPINLKAPVGIDERLLARVPLEDEKEILDDEYEASDEVEQE